MTPDERRDRQFEQVDAAVERMTDALITRMGNLACRHSRVSYQYVVEGVLMALSDKLTKVIDTECRMFGPASIQLSNALADYRDSRFEDRG